MNTKKDKLSVAGLVAQAFAVAFLSFTAPVQAQQSLQVLHGHVRPAVSSGRAALMGSLPRSQRMNLSIMLPLRNQAELSSLLARLYDPSSPDYHHFLSVDQFTEQFGPTAGDYKAVADFARANGFAVTDAPANRMVVPISGAVDQVENAFHLSMRVYRHPTEDRTFYSPDREPALALGIPVSHIAGLDNFSLPHPPLSQASMGQATPATTGSGPTGLFLGSDMRAAYYGGTALTGAGQAVAAIEFGGYNPSDVAEYFSQIGQVDSVPVNNVLLDGMSLTPQQTGYGPAWANEAALDITQLVGMAPGLSQIRVYIGSYDVDIFNKIASENICKQIGASLVEYDDTSNDDPIFEEFATQGQTLFAASGDWGVYPATEPAFPAEDIYATGVGGTTLTTTGPGGAWLSETVWNGGGGGVSPDGISIPSWQYGVANSANQGSSTLRNVPDVAMDANNDTYVIAFGLASGSGGTSASTQRWAGFMALVNQQAVAAGKSTMGMINPALYAIAEGAGYGSDFHDTTSGSDDCCITGEGLNAVPGYDLVTGWGSPAGQNLIDALAGAPATGFTLSNSTQTTGLAINLGSFASTTITVHDQGAFSGSVSLAVSGLPSGVTASFSPNSTATTSALTLTASSSAAVGMAYVTVTGTSGGVTASITIPVTVYAPGFALSAPPNLNGSYVGFSGSTTITVQDQGGFTGAVSLTAFGVPSGVTATFSPTTTTTTSTLTFTSTSSAVPGTYLLTVTGTSGALTASASVYLSVATPGFYLSDSPGSVNINAGAAGGSTITVDPYSGFSGGVSLSVSGLPSGVTASFTPNPTTSTSSLTLTAGATTTPATYNLTINGASGSLTSSAALSLTVNAVSQPAATPTFSVASGTYVSPFLVTITSATAGATIYYTTDGSFPTPASFLYTGPVVVASSETINAIATGGGFGSSSVGSAAYGIGNSIGIISTVAGNGTAGYNGDGIAATSAELNGPVATAEDSSGNLYIADRSRVRKVTPAGVISTFAGNGTGGFSGDGGLAINAEVSPGGVAVDRSGNLYITSGNIIRKVTVAGLISTVAGNGTQGYSGDGGPATSAELYDPSSVAFDSSGNFYFADLFNYRIRKVTPAGVISTVAGNGTQGFSGDGGLATSAEVNDPNGVAVDAGGNLYIADSSRIRKVTATGVISTVAGNGTYVYGGDGGPATSAGFRGIYSVAVDSSGDLYIMDFDRVRKVTPGGIISTAAGTGAYGYTGDGGSATGADLGDPSNTSVDSNGNFYISDEGTNRIRKVTLISLLTTTTTVVSSSNPSTGTQAVTFTATVTGSPGTATGSVTFYDGAASLGSGTLNDSGGATFTTSSLTGGSHPITAAYGGDSTFAPSTSGPVVQVVDIVSAAMPTFSPVAGTYTSPQVVTITSSTTGAAIYYTTDGSTPTTASFLYTVPVAVTSSETINAIAIGNGYGTSPVGTAAYVISNVIGVISTVAGNGTFGYNGDGGAATSTELNLPWEAVADSSGNLYIADSGNHRIRKVTPAGVISTVAGNGTPGYSGDGGAATAAQLRDVTGVALDASGNLYIADQTDDRIRKVTPVGVISTIAGNGAEGYSGDGGLATGTELYYPYGVTVDGSGNVYIADTYNERIRKVTPAGVISTVAGNGIAGYTGDGGAAISAELNHPYGICVDAGGNLFITDEWNQRIRKVTPTGFISTVAGNGTAGYNGDGEAATSAELNNPIRVSVDSSGNLYISDTANFRIRKVTPAGVISTAVGSGAGGYSGDGGAATGAGLYPYGITVDAGGNLYIADGSNNRIRKVTYESEPVAQTITFPTIGTQLVGTPLTLTATSTSGLPVTYSSSTTAVCAVSGSTATFVTMGTCTITASQPGNSIFAVATPVTQSFIAATNVPNVGYVAYWGINNSGITVSWSTDVPANTQLAYGTTTSLGQLSPLQTALTASHGVVLTTLLSGTKYYFVAQSTNASGVTGYSTLFSFTTTGTATGPPAISNVLAGNLSNTSATITWTTDQPSSSLVNYGTTPGYGSASTLDPTLVTSHTVTLTGLTQSTTYDFDVVSANAVAMSSTSGNSTFKTTSTSSPPVISNVLTGNLTNTSATITWTTDQPSSSLVNYGTTTGYGSASTLDPTLVTSHSVTLTSLTQGTTYDFDVTSANAAAQSSTSPNSTFKTTSTTSSPPVISNVATTNVTSTSATLTWTTDQASSSLVNYGTTTGYGSSSTLDPTLVTAHSVTLTGLAASTTYDFDVTSANATAQSTTSPNAMVTTTASNATPPYVGYVADWGINNTGVTVSWSTDVPATAQLAYGTTTALGQLSPLQTALTASHGVVLTTLNPGTTYYFVAQSTAANGATGYSSVMSFTTTGTQTTPPPVISNVAVSSITNTTAIVTWTTDQATSSQVNYGVTTTYTNSTTLDPTLVTSHSAMLTGLTAGTTYDFDVMSANSSALSATSPNATFLTTGTALGPMITNVNSSSVTSGTAIITWTTDQASTSLVNYGTTTGYGSTASSAGLGTTHSVMLTGLAPNTTYDFDVVSANAANTTSTSGNYTFKTSSNTAPPPVLSYLNYWGITGSGVTISWSTNELANTAVAYGTTNSLGQLSPVQTALSYNHGVTLTGLAAGTTYYFVAQSADGSGNTGYSTTYSFTTLPGPPTISNVTTNPAANNKATISWTTSTPTYSYVQYGTAAGNYFAYSPLTALTATPNCALGYVPSGTIHYQLVSTDAAGNQTTAPDMTFTEP